MKFLVISLLFSISLMASLLKNCVFEYKIETFENNCSTEKNAQGFGWIEQSRALDENNITIATCKRDYQVCEADLQSGTRDLNISENIIIYSEDQVCKDNGFLGYDEISNKCYKDNKCGGVDNLSEDENGNCQTEPRTSSYDITCKLDDEGSANGYVVNQNDPTKCTLDTTILDCPAGFSPKNNSDDCYKNIATCSFTLPQAILSSESVDRIDDLILFANNLYNTNKNIDRANLGELSYGNINNAWLKGLADYYSTTTSISDKISKDLANNLKSSTNAFTETNEEDLDLISSFVSSIRKMNAKDISALARKSYLTASEENRLIAYAGNTLAPLIKEYDYKTKNSTFRLENSQITHVNDEEREYIFPYDLKSNIEYLFSITNQDEKIEVRIINKDGTALKENKYIDEVFELLITNNDKLKNTLFSTSIVSDNVLCFENMAYTTVSSYSDNTIRGRIVCLDTEDVHGVIDLDPSESTVDSGKNISELNVKGVITEKSENPLLEKCISELNDGTTVIKNIANRDSVTKQFIKIPLLSDTNKDHYIYTDKNDTLPEIKGRAIEDSISANKEYLSNLDSYIVNDEMINMYSYFSQTINAYFPILCSKRTRFFS
jgi:hypothetical protein